LVWWLPSVTMVSFGESTVKRFRGRHATNPPS
jgi:hypothetical protein